MTNSKDLGSLNSHAVAIVLGIFQAALSTLGPVGAVAGSGITTVKAVRHGIKEREDQQRTKNIQAVLQDLSARVSNIENEQSSEQVKLHEEIFRRACEDDDENKMPAYGAIVEWVAQGRSEPAEVRLACRGVSELTAPELRSYVTWYNKGFGKLAFPGGLTERSLLQRLLLYGWIKQTEMVNSNFVTAIGKIVPERAPMLAWPDEKWANMLRR